MFLGVQIVSLMIMLCLIVRFTALRKLPTLSTIWYNVFLYVAVINFACEMFSLLTLYEKLPREWNLLSHVMFYISLIAVLHCFYLFIDIKVRNQRRYTLMEFIGRLIPLVILVLILIFGEVEYFIDGVTRYSQGSMVSGISALAGGYFLTYMITVRRHRATFEKRERATFIFIFIFITINTAIQLMVPALLLTSMSVVMMAMNMFMTFENPRELVDLEVKSTLNRTAFLTMANEYIERKQDFYIVSITLTNSQMINDAKGYKATLKYIEGAAQYLKKYAKTSLVFHPKREWVSLVFSDKKKYYAFMEEQREILIDEDATRHDAAKYLMTTLKCPNFAKNVDEIVKVLG